MTLNKDFKTRMEKQLAISGSFPEDIYHPAYSPLNQRLFEDHSRNILPGLLHYGDVISMAHGVESRLPFMDYRLVEWIFAHGDGVKIHEGRTKWILRQYLLKNGQSRIAERKDKQGYPTPIEKWLSEDRGAVVRDLLLTGESRITQFCDPIRIKLLLDRHLAGRVGAGSHLYRLISTELWLRSCL